MADSGFRAKKQVDQWIFYLKPWDFVPFLLSATVAGWVLGVSS